MFVGRKNELKSLNESYSTGAFQFPVIYGRRRVGKTTLINEFCKDKRTIYFAAIQSTEKENLKILSAQIIPVLAPNAPDNPFSSYSDAVDFIFDRAIKEHFVFVIDEYPYLAKSHTAVSSILQAAIDKYHENSKLFLILCGSSMSFMEKQVLGYKSPLYGRRTAQYKLQPFDYFESAKMLKGFSNEDKIALYSVTGGIPEYLSRIDRNLSVKENINNLFFSPAGRLFEEPENLLKQELKIPETYNAIIAAIASGRNKVNEISTKVGIETSQCSKMLLTLTELGLVRKEYPITEARSKKTIYHLDDWMFIFWYRFVLPELSRINAGLGKAACEEMFKGQFGSHIGFAFETCAIQYMWRAMKKNILPVSLRKIGRWWGNNQKERREEEIDIVAFSDNKAFFGECKWRNEKTGIDVLNDLERKAGLFTEFSDISYILFSKSPFTKSLSDIAGKRKDVILVDLNKIFRI